jgi:hypothetical protein
VVEVSKKKDRIMKNIISTIDITLEIPVKMRGIFPNKKPLTIEFEANTPKSVEDYIAEFYCENRPQVFKLTEEAMKDKKDEPKDEPKDKKDEDVQDSFDAVEFLENNYTNINEAILTLEREQVIEVAKLLKLSKNPNRVQTKVLIKKITHDIAVKIKQEEELEKHKNAE